MVLPEMATAAGAVEAACLARAGQTVEEAEGGTGHQPVLVSCPVAAIDSVVPGWLE